MLQRRAALERLKSELECARHTVAARPDVSEELPVDRLCELVRSAGGMAARVEEFRGRLEQLSGSGSEALTELEERLHEQVESLADENAKVLREHLPAMAEAVRRRTAELAANSGEVSRGWAATARRALEAFKADPSREWLSVLGGDRYTDPAGDPDVIPSVGEALECLEARMAKALEAPGTRLKFCLVVRDAAFVNVWPLGGDVVDHAEWQLFADRPGEPPEFLLRMNGGPQPAGAYASLPTWSNTNDPAVYAAMVAREFPATPELARLAVRATYSFTGRYLLGGWVCHTVAAKIAGKVLRMDPVEWKKVVRGSWLTDLALGREGRFNRPRPDADDL